MTTKPNSGTVSVSRELLVRINNLHTTGNDIDVELAEIRAILAQPADQQGEQMARMPVERCYDVRAKMIIAFNEAKKSGGDLDDQLDAAYKSALRFSPNPEAQPATAKVDERAAFEASGLKSENAVWHDGKYQFLSSNDEGEEEYVSGLGLDNLKFTAWLARAKLNGGQP